jgi:hypothetical protein
VSIPKLSLRSLAAFIGISTLSIHLDSAAALPFSGLFPRYPASSQIDKIGFRGGWRPVEGVGWNAGWGWRGAGLRPTTIPGSAGAANAARDATIALRPPYGSVCPRQALGSNGGWRFRHSC